MIDNCQTLTPPQVAKLWRVRVAKVLCWIRTGELRAFNVAERMGGRPKYRIALEDLEAFKNRRSVQPKPPAAPRYQPKRPALPKVYYP